MRGEAVHPFPTRRPPGYVQALQRMVVHCRRLMLDRETPPEGREEHRALIDYMESQIEQLQERAGTMCELRKAC